MKRLVLVASLLIGCQGVLADFDPYDYKSGYTKGFKAAYEGINKQLPDGDIVVPNKERETSDKRSEDQRGYVDGLIGAYRVMRGEE